MSDINPSMAICRAWAKTQSNILAGMNVEPEDNVIEANRFTMVLLSPSPWRHQVYKGREAQSLAETL